MKATKVTKEAVVKYLVKKGQNEQRAMEQVELYFDMAARCYECETVREFANHVAGFAAA